MKIWVINNLDTGYTAAFPTRNEAKEAMRVSEALWALREVEFGSGRENGCLIYNRSITPEMVQSEYEFESKNGRIRERK